MPRLKIVLPVIIISQFCCTSLWFAGNGIINDLVAIYNFPESAVGHLTSAVQFGFIAGTLFFAILSFADRYSPSKVFFICALLGALFNLGMIWDQNTLLSMIFFRFITGFFLAGIYPVGMKIAADYYEKGLGLTLGFLVGALVLGTAFPHFLKDIGESLAWESVLYTTSGLAAFGGILMYALVPNGPFHKSSRGMDRYAFFSVFRNRTFRSSAFGYFGHMWELYAFWAFTPLMLHSYQDFHSIQSFSIPLMSFFIIAIGSLGCVMSGYISQFMGTKRVAFIALSLSGICCLLYPFVFTIASSIGFLIFLLFWGIVVIADSPLFSTLVAQNAVPETKGTALTIVNCIGFAITIVSIQLIGFLRESFDSNYIYMILALGPLMGLIALRQDKKSVSVSL